MIRSLLFPLLPILTAVLLFAYAETLPFDATIPDPDAPEEENTPGTLPQGDHDSALLFGSGEISYRCLCNCGNAFLLVGTVILAVTSFGIISRRPPPSQWSLLLPLAPLLAGAILIAHAQTLPVYTDPTAPGRLSSALPPNPTEAQMENDWWIPLSASETPHKRLFDLGLGLAFFGAGSTAAALLWVLYERFPPLRRRPAIFTLWLLLWALGIPFSALYWSIRQARFDYPVGGDAVSISVLGQSVVLIAGAIVSSLVLGVLLVNHTLPPEIRLTTPQSRTAWIRAAVITCWIIGLAILIGNAIPDGDAGIVFTGPPAAAVLAIILASKKATRA